MYTVYIHWGSESTREETTNTACPYTFDTLAELDAFLLGVEEANGWMDYLIVDKDGVEI
jgi:hypothetical protein